MLAVASQMNQCPDPIPTTSSDLLVEEDTTQAAQTTEATTEAVDLTTQLTMNELKYVMHVREVLSK